jgi:hypothetical protein
VTEPSDSGLPSWGILELMGHRVLAGHVSEVTFAGAAALRIRIPGDDPEEWFAEQTYSSGSFYSFTPTTEDMARRYAADHRPAVVLYSQPALAGPRGMADDDDYSIDPDDEDNVL